MRESAFLQLGEAIRVPLYDVCSETAQGLPEDQTLFRLITKIQNELNYKKRSGTRSKNYSKYQYLVDQLRFGGGYGLKIPRDDKDACYDVGRSFGEAKRGNGEAFVAALLNCIWDHSHEWELFSEPLIQPDAMPLEEWLIAATAQLNRFCPPSTETGSDSEIHRLSSKVGPLTSESANVRLYLEAAKQGSASAMNNLAYALHHGVGVERNPKEAFRWYLKAAETGSPAGMNSTGFCYQNGVGTGQNYTEAARWYAKAVEHGDREAMNNLGFCYQNGYGLEQNVGKAFAWYYASAARGCPSGMNNLAYCYQHGWGTRQSFGDALSWYRKAAAHGKAAAMHSIGYFHHHGLGLPVDLSEAERWYSKARDAGDPAALNSLGTLFEKKHLRKPT